MSFEPQHVRARNITLSPNKQNTIGTALGDANLTQRPPVLDEGAFATIQKEYYSNIDRANKGHQWATVRQKVAQKTGFQFSFDVSDWLAGWMCAFCFGAVTTTGAGPYTHTFKFLQSTNISPLTTIYFEDTADIKYKMQDLAIAELMISGGARGPVQAQVNMLGTGRYTDGAMGAPAAPSSPTILLASDTDFLIGAPTAAASIKERVKQWQAKFTIGLQPHDAVGGGMFSTFVKIDTQRASWSAQVSAKDVDDMRTLFTNDTLQEVQINTNSGAAAQLNIKFPNTYVSAAQIGTDGKEEIWSIESDEMAQIKSGASEVAQVTVINGQATWLVGA
jgi:hypothetical protein